MDLPSQPRALVCPRPHRLLLGQARPLHGNADLQADDVEQPQLRLR